MVRTIVWFRGKELRLADHGPLRDALHAGGDVIPLFVLDPYFFAPERAQKLPHRIQYLLDSIAALADDLAKLGSQLVLVAGKSWQLVPRLADEWKADRVVAHRWVEPVGRERDRRIAEALGDRFVLYEGETLLPPGTLRTRAGHPHSLYASFAKAFLASASIGKPLPPPRSLPPLPKGIRSTTSLPSCEELGIARNPALLAGGERVARKQLTAFLRHGADSYAERRDRLDLDGTSRLSAPLKFGTISIRTVWNAVEKAFGDTASGRAFLRELLWREYAYHLLWSRPELLERPCRATFDVFPFREDERLWEAWAKGRTGYPVVDAAARQLLREGFVHNRARMITASFLTKHLLIDYRRGEAHFLEFLTDGDWANNNLGWQWCAGSGCDAQPWFRVFNPVAQGEKFDPEGAYVRRWLPELARLPARFVHRPWDAPEDVLAEAGVRLGETYPSPIVEHRVGRDRYLATAKRHLTGR